MLLFSKHHVDLDRKRRYLRHAMRAKRRALPEQVRQEADRAIYHQLLKYTRLKKATTVALYVSIDGEVDVFTPICLADMLLNLNVFLPKVIPTTTLEFYLYPKDGTLVKSSLGLKEPMAEEKNRLDPKRLDLLLVPLVAFDSKGYRLGMGGGYYDRLLTQWSRHVKPHPQIVGVAYNFQAVESIAVTEYDVPLPMVVTPDRAWYWPEHDYGFNKPFHYMRN